MQSNLSEIRCADREELHMTTADGDLEEQVKGLI